MVKKKGKKKRVKADNVKSSVIPSPDPQVEEVVVAEIEKPVEDGGKAGQAGSKELPVWLL
ncbi:MAG: hypothetical protein M1269_01485 [Chloroflexi bacterium]|nr:hypothetical protein [Chloroflexota bacterium]